MTAPAIAPEPRRRDLLELHQLRLAIEASGEIVFTTDATGTFTYVNREFERAYGYVASDVIGRVTPRILKSGTTPAEEYEALWTQLAHNTVVKREFINRTSTGELLRIETSANPIVDDSGRVVGFLAVQRDITARTRMQAALRDSERRYRALADAAPDTVFIVNRQREIEYVNHVSAESVGKTPADMVGKRLDQVFPSDTAEVMWRQLSMVFASGERQFFEDRFAVADRELWLETWLVPLESEHGSVHAVMGVARDVSARKALERQFLQSQKMEVVGRLAGGIAHDFNNLLTAILGYTELLQQELYMMPGVLADLGEIRKAGERASRLTRQLLAFSRKQKMVAQSIDLNALLVDIQKMLARTLGEDIELSVIAAHDLPAIVADPSHIEQVVLNLAVNARDAMPKGGRLTISTRNTLLTAADARERVGAAAGSYVTLTLQDTGCGIPADVLPHVFEPFFTTKSSGTGLGLSTVYGIVSQHGGHVTIDTAPDVGTTIHVFWPCQTARDAAAAESGAAVVPAGGRETILLVEDEASLRTLMRKTLEPYGYTVLEANDVGDALTMAAEFAGAIDLLLSDVIMPGLNGPDLAQRVVARRPQIKVLYVSGFPHSLLPDQAERRDFIGFLGKPFTPRALATKVRECLDARRDGLRRPCESAHAGDSKCD